MTTAQAWATEEFNQADFAKAVLNKHRLAVQGEKARADAMLSDLINRPNAFHVVDDEIVGMIRRLHVACMVEHEKAVEILTKGYEGLEKEPGQGWHVANTERGLYKDSEPLVRMKKINDTMYELTILPFYEKSLEE